MKHLLLPFCFFFFSYCLAQNLVPLLDFQKYLNRLSAVLLAAYLTIGSNMQDIRLLPQEFIVEKLIDLQTSHPPAAYR
jgi:hypothetical protein